jgi:hypothetical protein
MANYTKKFLSGSTNGKSIVVSTSGSGSAITIHQAVNSVIDIDEIWLYAYNSDEAYQTIHLTWGEVVDPDGIISATIPPNSGPVLIIPGWLLQNNLYVKAFADEANLVMINGWVNRISAGSA